MIVMVLAIWNCINVPYSLAFNEGDDGDAWYIVYHGEVDVLKAGKKIAVIGKNECFGEMAILEDLPRSATVMASTDCLLLRISKEAFDELISDDHPVAYKLAYEMAKMLASRARVTSEWLTDLLNEERMKYMQTELTVLVHQL